MTEEEYNVVDAMDDFGGSFVKSLAQCFRQADDNNFRKLKEAFSNYWSQYEKMAKREE
jgi:hypothetical protein